ncbi:MAG: HipA N-terminal domain-containing protein [Lachnospiraceae bacterium]|nr:HipA N-terminal domain-containing protein [Lachnospiraceae bacterium]
MARAGKVFVQNKYAGRIYETDEGYEFAYDEDYLRDSSAVSLSLTMPLTDSVYKSNTLFPFFDGLIPEGWLLGLVERNWKIDGKDRFGLMLVTCRDCIGDVYVEAE